MSGPVDLLSKTASGLTIAMEYLSLATAAVEGANSGVAAFDAGMTLVKEGPSAKQAGRLIGEVACAAGQAAFVTASVKRKWVSEASTSTVGFSSEERAELIAKTKDALKQSQQIALLGLASALVGRVTSNYFMQQTILLDMRVWRTLLTMGHEATTGYKIALDPDDNVYVSTLHISEGTELTEADKINGVQEKIRSLAQAKETQIVYITVVMGDCGILCRGLYDSLPKLAATGVKASRFLFNAIASACHRPSVPPVGVEGAVGGAGDAPAAGGAGIPPEPEPLPRLGIPEGLNAARFPHLEIGALSYPDLPEGSGIGHLVCSITRRPLRFPVVAWDARNPMQIFLFERKAIVSRLLTNPTNPYTGGPMNLSDLREHLPFREAIEATLLDPVA